MGNLTPLRHVMLHDDPLADEFDAILNTREIFALRSAEAAVVVAKMTDPTALEKSVIDYVVDTLNAAGIWSTLDSFQFYAMDGETNALVDWVATGPAVNNGAAHVPKSGFKFDAASDYIDTSIIPANMAQQGAGDVRMFIRGSNIRAAFDGGNRMLCGAVHDTDPDARMYIQGQSLTPNTFKFQIQANSSPSSDRTTVDANNSVVVGEFTGGSVKGHINGVEVCTQSRTNQAECDQAIFVNGHQTTTQTHGFGAAGWTAACWGMGSSGIDEVLFNDTITMAMAKMQGLWLRDPGIIHERILEANWTAVVSETTPGNTTHSDVPEGVSCTFAAAGIDNNDYLQLTRNSMTMTLGAWCGVRLKFDPFTLVADSDVAHQNHEIMFRLSNDATLGSNYKQYVLGNVMRKPQDSIWYMRGADTNANNDRVSEAGTGCDMTSTIRSMQIRVKGKSAGLLNDMNVIVSDLYSTAPRFAPVVTHIFDDQEEGQYDGYTGTPGGIDEGWGDAGLFGSMAINGHVVGGSGNMTWAEINEMIDDGGFTVLNHGIEHRSWVDPVVPDTSEVALKYKALNTGFTVGENVTGSLGGSGTNIISVTDDDADSGNKGTIIFTSVSVDFADNETLTGSVTGAATASHKNYSRSSQYNDNVTEIAAQLTASPAGDESDYWVWPYNEYDANAITLLKDTLNCNGGRGVSEPAKMDRGQLWGFNPVLPITAIGQTFNLSHMSTGNSHASGDDANTMLDRAIEAGVPIIVTLHNLVASGASGNEWNYSDFNTYTAHLKSLKGSGQISVKTFGDFVRGLRFSLDD